MEEDEDWRLILDDFEGHLDRYSPTTIFPCVFCSFEISSPIEIIRHLFLNHSFFISKCSNLALLDRYLDYYRLNSPKLTEVLLKTKTFLTIQSDDENEKSLREILHKDRLETIMLQHEIERTTIFPQLRCIFCNSSFRGTWHQYLQWLFEVHQFNPGRPSNLVHIEELIDYLRPFILNFQCFNCGRTLENSKQLRNHMRKKPHGKIPNEKRFDRYYMVNYLEIERKWLEVQEDDEDIFETLEEGIQDIDDEKEVNNTQCLICDKILIDPEEMVIHLRDNHQFDFSEIRQVFENNFYHFVKFINFIRKKKSEGICFVCDLNVYGEYSDHIHLHLRKIPEDFEPFLHSEEFLIPFIASDPLLTVLEDVF